MLDILLLYKRNTGFGQLFFIWERQKESRQRRLARDPGSTGRMVGLSDLKRPFQSKQCYDSVML